MSDLMRYYGASGNPLSTYLRGMDVLRDHLHGGARAIMDSLPISGKVRRFKNEVKKADDRYRNTGVDEPYSSPYNASLPFVNDALGAVAKPARMASSLMKMYGVEVELDVQRTRLEANREYTRSAHAWQAYEMMRANRRDY